MNYTYEDMAKMIDHSLLNPTLTVDDLERGIQLALEYDVASVCIMPYYLKRCAEALRGSRVNSAWRPHHGHQGGGGAASAGGRLPGARHGGEYRRSAQRRLGLCAGGH